MNIVIATDSFKGSLQTLEAAEAIRKGVLRAVPDANIKIFPIADGGEGTVEAMVAGRGGEICWYPVIDLMGLPVDAPVGYLDKETAVIEVAAASGLSRVKPCEESIKKATTYGTGQLLLHAIDRGCRKIYVGMGGSGTNDVGIGFAQALGYRFYDRGGNLIPLGKASVLQEISHIDCTEIDRRLETVSVIAVSDVDNPLLGEWGAANVFGRQKGMTDDLVPVFDEAAKRFAGLLNKEFGKSFEDIPGAGAAGGFGFGLLAFANAKMQKGIDTILDVVNFDKEIERADLIITGEGCLDFQSIRGKVPIGVAQRAKKQKKNVAAVVGSVGREYELAYAYGLDAVESSVAFPQTLDNALGKAAELVEEAAERLLRTIVMGQSMMEV